MINAAVGLFFFRYLKKLSQQALSYGYPFFENDCTTLHSSKTFLKAYEVYCVPLSEWNIRPFGQPREVYAFLNTSITGLASALEDIFHEITFLENRSIITHRKYHFPFTFIYVISLAHTRFGAFWSKFWSRWLWQSPSAPAVVLYLGFAVDISGSCIDLIRRYTLPTLILMP